MSLSLSVLSREGSLIESLFLMLDERTQIIRRADILRSSAGSSSSGLVDRMAGGRLILIPETAVEPRRNDRTFIAVAGFLGEPIVDAINVWKRFEGIHKALDKLILSGYRAGPYITGIIVDAR